MPDIVIQAIDAKLDELLRADGRARSKLTELDDEEPEVIVDSRLRERRLWADGSRST